MQNGDSAVHIVSDLVLITNGYLEESTTFESAGNDQGPGEDESSSFHVHFTTDPDHALLFDSLK